MTKREETEQCVVEIAEELREMHENSLKLSEVQYCSWAQMLVHSGKENPPQVPMITGSTRRQVFQEKDLEESIVSIAAVVVKAVTQNSPCSSLWFNHHKLIRQSCIVKAQNTGQDWVFHLVKFQKFVVSATHSWLHLSSSDL